MAHSTRLEGIKYGETCPKGKKLREIRMCPTILKCSNVFCTYACRCELVCVCIMVDLKSNMAMVVDRVDMNNFAWSRNLKNPTIMVGADFFCSGSYLFVQKVYRLHRLAHTSREVSAIINAKYPYNVVPWPYHTYYGK